MTSAERMSAARTPGQSYFGRNNDIEYLAGNAPVIYSTPHGGPLTPFEIPICSTAATVSF